MSRNCFMEFVEQSSSEIALNYIGFITLLEQKLRLFIFK